MPGPCAYQSQYSSRRRAVPAGVPLTNVYVNEHLTPFNKNLLFNAKKLKLSGWMYVWTKEGKILAKKNEGGKTLRVTSLEQIDRLLGVSGQATVS
ncbi:hypothetical protein J6590_046003 [Homalodisca vitripennis]|nr:hypothetical protein J6590_046003 [Homalodisca vitripennis]